MREVNNNTINSANLNFQGVSSAKKDVLPQETVETTDLSKMPADIIGRSQVTKPAIEEDLAIFQNNKELVEKSEKLMDMLLNDYHMDYEKACEIVTATVKEFSK
jgi:hypothetical protein